MKSPKTTWPADKVERRTVESLVPYARNARTHSDAQVAQIAASITEWGWTTPVLVDETGSIIAGHGRVMAARKLGLVDVPVMVATGWSDAQKQAYVLADNQLALNAGWDAEMLKVELTDLAGAGFDVSLIGFSEDELAKLTADKTEGLTDPDAVPEVPVNPVTVLGDVWVLGKHRVMCGDSTSVDAVDKLMAGEAVDMVLTDPPYGISIVKGGEVGGDNLAKTGTYAPVAGDDTIDVAIEAIQVIKTLSAKVEIIWGGNYYANALENSSCWIVWDKRDAMAGNNFADCELAWTNQKTAVRKFAHTWNGMIKASEHGQKRVHPTQKPVILSEWCIDQYGEDCLTVLDLFGGSGSSLMACEKKKKHARMMELSPNYCDVIIKRWQDFTGQKATLESDGRTFEDVAAARYDWKQDATGSYDAAIAEKRKELTDARA